MTLDELRVLHLGTATEQPPEAARRAAAAGEVLMLHTCQRLVLMGLGEQAVTRWHAAPDRSAGGEVYSGAEAYAFMLRLACGLESRLLGETEVFGQFKHAWSVLEAGDSPLARALVSCVQALFRDAKEIRSQYLTGIGSASYGSLVRKLLGGNAASGPVLVIGAGQLAHAVTPWLKGGELWLWNRSVERARELAVELQRRDPQRVIKVLDADGESELSAWQQASSIVVCVPADAARDPGRANAWNGRRVRTGRLVHLGVNRSDLPPAWSATPDLLDLGTVFEQLQAQNELRRAQVQRALAACRQKAAQVRGEATVPHNSVHAARDRTTSSNS